MQTREELLQQFAGIVDRNARSGVLGVPVHAIHLRGIAGPRAGALELWAAEHTGALLRVLTRDDAALLRQMIPWDFGRNRPNAFMSGRYLRLDAPWPDALAETNIPLSALGRHPDGDGRWIAGKNEMGDTITIGFSLDRTPHWLFSGTTGSGKTVSVHTALVQLARDPQNRFILVDGKRGHSLRQLACLRGRIGPIAANPLEWKTALLWANTEMNRRFNNPGDNTRLVVVVEEIQEIIADASCAEAITRLVTLGREVSVHCLLTTQHPTVKALGGPRVARNLAGRLALKVTDDVASRVAVGGSTPRADYLLGRGDGYAVSVDTIHRAQMAFAEETDIAQASGGEAELPAWDAIKVDDLGDAPGPAHRPQDNLTAAEIGAILIAAQQQMGRRRFQDFAEETTGDRPGSDKADRLIHLGQAALEWLESEGYTVMEME